MAVPSGNFRTRLIVSLCDHERRVNVAGITYLPNLDVPTAIVLRPDAEDVLAASNTEDEATYFISSFDELVSNQRHEQLLPVPVCNSDRKSVV